MKYGKNDKLTKSSKHQLGASLVEYGLLLSMISLMALAGVRQTGTHLSCAFTKVSGHLQGLQNQSSVCANGGIPAFIPLVAAPDSSYNNRAGVGNGGVSAPIDPYFPIDEQYSP